MKTQYKSIFPFIEKSKEFLLLIFLATISLNGWAQPTVLGTQLIDGSYSKHDLIAVGGLFKQIRLQATSSAAVSTRNWEFASGTAASTSYNPNWRPYDINNTLSSNIFIPIGWANGARYNSGGGESGLLPAITSGNYYTFNVSNNSGNNVMQLLETTYYPVTISSVTLSVGNSGSLNISITASGTPDAAEYIYVRYSSDSYVTSTLAQATGSGTSWSVNIPWQAAAISFYVYTSNKTLTQINNDVTTNGYGQVVHDLSTLNLKNNSGSNYSWSFPSGNFIVSSTGGTFANGIGYASLTNASGAFAALNTASAGTGAVTIYVNGNSTSETGLYPLNNSSNWTSINMYPIVTGLTISGTQAKPIIDLNGADNVTIDGRVNATGSTKDLIILNDSPTSTAGTSTIRLYNGALSNTFKYCNIKGSSMDPSGGIIFLSTTPANTGNIIDNNNITCSPNGYRPINVIYSSGAANTITISNNNIYNFFNSAASSYGVNLNTSTAASTISGNSFYEMASFTPIVSGTIVEYTAININSTATGFNVSGNYIGGSGASCSGYWTKTNAYINPFRGIKLNVGTGSPSIVEDNTIKGFAWSNLGLDPANPLRYYAYFMGIYANAGDITIGSLGHPNLIGETSGTGSITLTNGASESAFTGINISGTGYISCEYNNIGAITVANNDDARSTAFAGIYRDNTNANGTISNNSIGSSTSNSINATSLSSSGAQNVQAIWNNGVASNNLIIDNNTIVNMKNGTTNSTLGTMGVVNGIYNTASAVLTITNNTIHDLTIANANNTTNASASGIVVTTSTQSTVSNNTIYNLSNTYPSYTGFISGIFFTGGAGVNTCSNNTIYGLSATGATVGAATIVALNYMAGTGANVTNANFIHSLSVPNSSTATIYGIRAQTGVNTYSNNIISLGGASNITQIGFYDTGAASQTCNLYYNTISISGTVASGSNKTYCLVGEGASNTRNFRNNIFSNTRSTAGGSSLHYAVLLPANLGLTSNYNDYFVSGTGGVLGYYGVAGLGGTDKSTLALWKAATGQDANSYATNPALVNAISATATDYKSLWNMAGATGSGITTDYANVVTRSVTTPSIGAWERVSSDFNLWTGNASSVYNNLSNWSKGVLPLSTENIVFADSPSNDCILDADRTVANVINQSSKSLIIPTATALTVSNEISTGGTPSRILIKASSNGSVANGSLIYHNTVANPVTATVEMFDKATIVNPGGSTTNAANYHWQYFGIPLRSMVPLGTFNGSYIRRWNNPTSAWVLQNNASVLTSFTGYEVAQSTTKTITFAGTLENGDYSTTLDTKDGTTIAGQYLFANPYTAAINIASMTFGAQTDNSVYLFNTGSSAETAAAPAASGTYGPSTTPGQYIVCPKQIVGEGVGIPRQIPSMAGFLIKDTNVGGDHSFGITYNSVIQANSTTQRAKKVDTSVCTIVDVKGTRYADRMWVFTNPNCTHGFDNGWDGRKELGLAFTPQLFAVEADGNYQVNSVNDINNTDLAFQAGEDTNYTLTFTHQNTVNAYSSLYLIDLLENKTIDISQTGTEYSFTATSSTTPEKRFKIVTATGGITQNLNVNDKGLRIFGVQNNIIIHNYGSSGGKLVLYDLKGIELQSAIIMPVGITTVNTSLPDGCYIVKAKTNSMEVTEKVIFNKSSK